MNCKYFKALAVVSALCFMSGFIAYRVGAFDEYLRPAPVEPEASTEPAVLPGSKSLSNLGVGRSAPASASPGPAGFMGGSKSIEIPRQTGDGTGGRLPPMDDTPTPAPPPPTILPGSKSSPAFTPTIIVPGAKITPAGK